MLKNTRLAGALALALAATGCTTAQQTTASSYQAAISTACSVAMTFAPAAGPVAPWIIGGCATEQAIAKLALDPSSLTWVNNLIAMVRGA